LPFFHYGNSGKLLYDFHFVTFFAAKEMFFVFGDEGGMGLSATSAPAADGFDPRLTCLIRS
jgi:hypothetical protein